MNPLLLMLSSGMGLAAPPALVAGNSSSPVRVVIYEDLQCSDCAAFRKMLDGKLLPRYGSKVAFGHRDFPLAKHSWARRAAIAGRHFADAALVNGAPFIETITVEEISQGIDQALKEHGINDR